MLEGQENKFCLQYVNVRSGEIFFFVSVRPGSLGPIFLARDFSLQFSMIILDINLRKGPQSNLLRINGITGVVSLVAKSAAAALTLNW